MSIASFWNAQTPELWVSWTFL